MTDTIATAVIVNGNMPPFRIPVHGWNDSGVIAWTAEQLNDRTFEIIPWHRVESVTVTLGDWLNPGDYAEVILDPTYPAPSQAESGACNYQWEGTTPNGNVSISHLCRLSKNHQWHHICIHCEASYL